MPALHLIDQTPIEEYLEDEQQVKLRHEYTHGEVYATAEVSTQSQVFNYQVFN